jgi:tRNA pseudouridine(55) synthase
LKIQKNNHIPDSGHTYIKYRIITDACILIYKKVGFTPLQVLNEVRKYINDEDKNKLTFVGRLDPMAEGGIHILWSGDKKEKDSLLKQDKEYKIKVLLGVKTDTDDILGLIDSVSNQKIDFDKSILERFIGPFNFDYPKYSSPHIKKTLKGENVDYRKQDGYIYSIDFLGLENVSNNELKQRVFDKLSLCKMEGDFRLEKIKIAWNNFFDENKNDFQIISLKVKCGRGTYMRVLSRELGGLAIEIVRE